MRIESFAIAAAALFTWAAAEPCLAVSPPENPPLANPSAARVAGAHVPLAASVSAGEHGLHWGLSLGMPVAAPASGLAARRPTWRVDALFNASHDPGLHAPAGGLATSLRLERARERTAAWLGVSRGGSRDSRDPEARLRWGGGLAQLLGEVRGEVSWVMSSVLFASDSSQTRTWQEFVPTEKPDSFFVVWHTETLPSQKRERFWQTAQASLRWARGRFSMDGVGGLSLGEGVTARRWAQARMGVQLSPRVGMLAAWGERPAAALAFEENAPPRTMVGVEFTPFTPSGARHDGPPRLTAWRATPAGPGLLLVRVQARDARAVDLSGDLTDWAPLPLERTNGGWWAVLLHAPAGVHRVQVRVDGGAWAAPPGLPRAADAGGGPAGVLLVAGD